MRPARRRRLRRAAITAALARCTRVAVRRDCARRLPARSRPARAGQRPRPARVGDQRRPRPPVLHRRRRRAAAAHGPPQLRAARARLGIRAPGGLTFLPGRLAAGRLRRLGGHRAQRSAAGGPAAGRPADRRAAALRRGADDGQRGDPGPRRRDLRVQRLRPRRRPRARRRGDPDLGEVASSNGLVVDTTGRWLYVAQTFVPAAISRVEIADPAHVETWYAAPAADSGAALDGLTRDAHDRLYVAANLGGEVWRVQDRRPRHACSPTCRRVGPSAVAFGSARRRPRRAPAGLRPPQPLRGHLPGRADPAQGRPRPQPLGPGELRHTGGTQS